MTKHVVRIPFVAVLFLLFFVTQPLPAADVPSEMVCAPPPNDGPVWVSAIVPLQHSERLLYSIEGLSGSTLEIRYRVGTELQVTETLDLASVELPVSGMTGPAAPPRDLPLVQKGGETAAPPAERRAAVQGPRVLELLALNADTTRELHRLAREGAAIELDVLLDGKLRETIAFDTLVQRSVTLREAPMVPVVAASKVSGPGVAAGPRRLRVGTNEYLENCWECTESHPCETECGYDPGKGGPTTCGEYGAPCEPYCSPSWTSGEWWGPWQYVSTTWSGGECLLTWTGHRWHSRRVTTYRRERIRRTTTCPNSPSCSGCYDTESVIDVQYGYSYCYAETGGSCFNGQTPCCSTCSVYGWTACTNSFPCF